MYFSKAQHSELNYEILNFLTNGGHCQTRLSSDDDRSSTGAEFVFDLSVVVQAALALPYYLRDKLTLKDVWRVVPLDVCIESGDVHGEFWLTPEKTPDSYMLNRIPVNDLRDILVYLENREPIPFEFSKDDAAFFELFEDEDDDEDGDPLANSVLRKRVAALAKTLTQNGAGLYDDVCEEDDDEYEEDDEDWDADEDEDEHEDDDDSEYETASEILINIAVSNGAEYPVPHVEPYLTNLLNVDRERWTRTYSAMEMCGAFLPVVAELEYPELFETLPISSVYQAAHNVGVQLPEQCKTSGLHNLGLILMLIRETLENYKRES